MALFIGLQASATDNVPSGAQTTPAQITANISFNVNAAGTEINPYVLGTNLPAWLGTARTQNNTFINRTKATRTTMLRLPGGSWSNGYDWYACEMKDGSKCSSASWGLNPTSFIDFLQATGTQAMYTINQNGTSKEAAALVAFFNGSVNDNRAIGVDVRGRNWGLVSDWAKLRRDHGNADPIGLKYFEIGNEIYGGKPGMGKDCAGWGWEDVWTCDGREYVNGIGSGANRKEGYLEFRTAMKWVDSSIQVGAVGVTPQDSWSNWGNEVIQAAGSALDFYIIHQYAYFEPPSGYQDVLAQPQSAWSSIMSDYENALDEYANGRSVPVAITEHNLFATQDKDNSQWMTRGVNMLFMADSLGQMITHGIDIANQWDLANGQAWNGTDYGLLNADSYARSPQYYVFPLWRRFGQTMLPVTSSHNAASQLSVYAGRIDPWTVSVMAVNKTGSPIQTSIQLQNAPALLIGGTADVARTTSLDSQSATFNGVGNPNDSLSNAPAANLGVIANPLTYTFQPYSVTLLRLQVKEFIPTDWVYLPAIVR